MKNYCVVRKLASVMPNNKDTDQLSCYRAADLRLFLHMQKAGFLTKLKLRVLGKFCDPSFDPTND